MKTVAFACSTKKDLFRIAPILVKLKEMNCDISPIVCYCGSTIRTDSFPIEYQQLGIPNRTYHYEIHDVTANDQINQLMQHFEETLIHNKVDLIVLPSYYYLSVAYCIVGSKLEIPICNLDAGLRNSEEKDRLKNYRLVIDSLTTLFFCTEVLMMQNLLKEKPDTKLIYKAGNPLYECLNAMEPMISAKDAKTDHPSSGFALAYLFTDPASLENQKYEIILEALKYIGKRYKILMPVPSVSVGVKLESAIIRDELNMKLVGRLEYPEYLAFMKKAQFIITDSCTIQEESSFFNIPCLSLQEFAERPSTVDKGTNIPVGLDIELIRKKVDDLSDSDGNGGQLNLVLLDTSASEYIISKISEFLFAD